MERSDDSNVQDLEQELRQLKRRREQVLNTIFRSCLGDRHKIQFYTDELLSDCINLFLRVLRGDSVASNMYVKAGICLGLISNVHTKGALYIVANGGIPAILEVMKAKPRDESLQAAFLNTLSAIAIRLDDKQPFVDAVERVVSAMERLPGSSSVYEAACHFVLAVSPKLDFNLFEHDLLVRNIVGGLDIHGHDDKAHFAGCRAIECLVLDPVLARHIVEDAEYKQNPGAVA